MKTPGPEAPMANVAKYQHASEPTRAPTPSSTIPSQASDAPTPCAESAAAARRTRESIPAYALAEPERDADAEGEPLDDGEGDGEPLGEREPRVAQSTGPHAVTVART